MSFLQRKPLLFVLFIASFSALPALRAHTAWDDRSTQITGGVNTNVGIAYNGERFLMVTGTATYWRSAAGTSNWTFSGFNFPTTNVSGLSIAHGVGATVVAGSKNVLLRTTVLNPVGTDWTSQRPLVRPDSSTPTLYRARFLNGQFVIGAASYFDAANSANSYSEAITSPDGLTWTSRKFPTSTLANNSYHLRDVAFKAGATAGAGTYAFTTNTNTVLVVPESLASASRVTFSANGSDTAAVIQHGAGVFLVITGNGKVFTSPTGAQGTWTQRTQPVATSAWNDVFFDGTRFVAVGATVTGGSPARAAVIHSTDGVTWTEPTTPPATSQNLVSVLRADGLWLAAGGGRNLFTSGQSSVTAPAFNPQPAAFFGTLGGTITLTATATGSPAPTYQWQKGETALVNDTRISGATTATLTITGATFADAGSYRLVATNLAGATSSDPALVALNASAAGAVFTPFQSTNSLGGGLLPGASPATALPGAGIAARFTVGTGLTPLPNTTVNLVSYFTLGDLSPDGTKAVYNASGKNAPLVYDLSTNTGTLLPVPTLPLGPIASYIVFSAQGIANNGNVTGIFADANGQNYAFHYAAAAQTYTLLGNVPNANSDIASTPGDISADGTTISGYERTGPFNGAFIWQTTGGFTLLPDPAGGLANGDIRALSPSARYIVGYGLAPAALGSGYTAFRWDRGSPLGAPVATALAKRTGDTFADARTVNDDGTVGGNVRAGFAFDANRAAIWMPDGTLVVLPDYLQSTYGLTTPGYTLSQVTSISADRRTVSGTAIDSSGQSDGWILTLPAPITAVTKTAQTITFSPPSSKTFGDPAFTLPAATASSGLAVTLTVVSGPATLNGSTLTLTGAGVVLLRATQAGNATYSAAPTVDRVITVAKAPQTITFAPLAAKTTTSPAFTLTATTTAPGLTVAFALTGPATLEGDLVNLAGTEGTVEITATQSGNANYAAAEPVIRSFNVTALPPGPPTIAQTITFAQPAPRTYGDAPFALVATTDAARLAVTFTVVSSTPAGIATLAGDAKTLTLTGAGSVVLRADQPGDATRKPATAVTRTLVVNKKTLLVSGVAATRLVGLDNPALALTYTGFVNGDDSTDLAATRPKAATKATKASAPGDYPITFTGGLDKNYTFAPGPVENLTVVGFGGTYEALLEVAGRFPVGKLTLTIPPAALTYSGTLTLAREAKPIPVASTSKSPGTTAFVGSTDFANAAATWTRSTNGVDALELSVTVSADGTLAGSLDRNGEPFAVLTRGARLRTFAKGQTAPGAGANTLALHPAYNLFDSEGSTPSSSLLTPSSFPHGSGYATAPIAPTTGVLTLKGFTADGSPLTASLKPTVDDTYLLWVNPYGTRTESYLAGTLSLQNHPETTRFPGRAYIPRDAGLLTWQKAALPANTATAKLDKSYRAGFGPLGVEVSLDPWLPPSARAVGTIPAGTLAQRLGLAANATTPGALTISHGPEDLDLGARENLLPFEGTLSSAGVFTAANASATAWTIKITPATGAFTGSFTLSDQVSPAPAKPVARKVTFSGVLRQAPAVESEVATGFFLVPGFPVPKGSAPAEQPSGEIRFAAP